MLETFSGRHASQDKNELTRFIMFMRERRCERYLEIGARHGDTFHYIMKELGKSVRGLAVDLPGAAWGQHKSAQQLTRAVSNLQTQGFQADLVFGDSHDSNTISRCMKDAPFDFVLIDGDHSYKAVSQDFRDYAPMASYVAFHDIVGHTQSTVHEGQSYMVEVPKLWAEIKNQFQSWEFVEKKSLMGIGVIKVN